MERFEMTADELRTLEKTGVAEIRGYSGRPATADQAIAAPSLVQMYTQWGDVYDLVRHENKIVANRCDADDLTLQEALVYVKLRAKVLVLGRDAKIIDVDGHGDQVELQFMDGSRGWYTFEEAAELIAGKEGEFVDQVFGCPNCGERESDQLVIDRPAEFVTCLTCGHTYDLP